MEITIKIAGEDSQLLKSLLDLGLEARLVKHAILCKPGYNQEEESFFIPDQVLAKHFALLINCEESGGATTNAGNATIVCGLSGGKFKPYFIPKSGNLSNGVHAMFSVTESVVTVIAHREQTDVEIFMHSIERSNALISINTEKIWAGYDYNLPKMYAMYEDAVKAARGKAMCYHCRCVHYALI